MVYFAPKYYEKCSKQLLLPSFYIFWEVKKLVWKALFLAQRTLSPLQYPKCVRSKEYGYSVRIEWWMQHDTTTFGSESICASFTPVFSHQCRNFPKTTERWYQTCFFFFCWKTNNFFSYHLNLIY